MSNAYPLPALHAMTATDVDPTKFISIARQVGAPSVALFINVPQQGLDFPIVTPARKNEIRRVLDGEGVSVANLDFFGVIPDLPADRHRAEFELGAALGGKKVVVLIGDFDRNRALDGFARMCALAGEYGLEVGLEFMRFTPVCDSLRKAADFIIDSGATNAGVGIDILHLARTGGTPADIAAIDPKLFSHAQLCDGPLMVPDDQQMFEATAQRMIPGEGELPLEAFIRALPPGIAFDLEVPLRSHQDAGLSALERARKVMDGARQVLTAAGRLM